MKRLPIYISLGILLSSCSSSTQDYVDPKVYSESFIQAAFPADALTYKLVAGSSNTIEISISKSDPDLDKKRLDKQKLKELCEYYGDTKFNSYRIDPNEIQIIADEIKGMDIVCDIDFDPEHPAGTSLADITMYYIKTLYPFIKSGYTKYEYGNDIPPGDNFFFGRPEFHTVYNLLSEFKAEDMILLGLQMELRFTKPRPEGKQTYTITLKTKDKTYENKVTIG